MLDDQDDMPLWLTHSISEFENIIIENENMIRFRNIDGMAPAAFSRRY